MLVAFTSERNAFSVEASSEVRALLIVAASPCARHRIVGLTSWRRNGHGSIRKNQKRDFAPACALLRRLESAGAAAQASWTLGSSE
jgi:hypothetical protein